MLNPIVYVPFVIASLSIADIKELRFQNSIFSKLGYEHMVSYCEEKYKNTMEYNYIKQEDITNEFIEKYQDIINR